MMIKTNANATLSKKTFAARAGIALTLMTAALACGDDSQKPGGAGTAGPGAQTAKAEVDAALPGYQKSADAIEGNINSIGSDTMNNLMTLWTERFHDLYPGVKPQIEGKGSGTAPPALTEGTSQFGPMSRDMKAEESEGFEKKYGYKPTRLRTAADALAVYVHHDNPIKSLSLTQIDSIFSSTRKRGGKDITTWGDLGLTGDWANKPINLYGRNSASGTYGYFKEHALKKGDYRSTVKEQPGSSSVVQGISEDMYAIGYSGMGFVTSSVRTVPIAEKDGGQAYAADAESVKAGTYPLSRYLNLYVNKAPGQPLSPMIREFCKFIFSKEGQEIVVKDGFLPLEEKFAAGERKLFE